MFEILAMLMFITLLILFIVIASRLGTVDQKVKAMEKRVSTMQTDVRILEDEVRSLITRAPRIDGAATETGTTIPFQPEPTTDPAAVSKPQTPPSPSAPTMIQTPPLSHVTPVVPAPNVPAPAVPKPPAPAIAPRSKQDWEMLIGGKLLNRIGAFALIIAVGFFFKYAVDKNWISETLRVCIGAGFGLALLGGGMWFERRTMQIFAQGLIGAGIAILYLSVYATFNFYQLVPQVAAFILMSAVTALTLFLAFRYDSLAVSLLGWAGGFLTPLMLSTGETNEIGLFTYVALLDAGLLLVILQKERWLILQPLTVIATYVLYNAWYTSSYQEPQLSVTLVFLALFWLLFFLSEMAHLVRPLSKYMEIHEFVAAINVLFFAVGIQSLLEPAHHNFAGPAILVIGLVYFGSFLSVRGTQGVMPMSRMRLVLTAILMLVWATGARFDGFTLAALWSMEALGLYWAGVRWDHPAARWCGIGLHALALLFLLGTDNAFTYADVDDYRFLLNQRFMAFVSLAVSLGVSARLSENVQPEAKHPWPHIYHYAWIVVVLLLASIETDDLFRSWMHGAREMDFIHLQFAALMTLSGVWSLLALFLLWTGHRTHRPSWLYSGLGILALAIFIGGIRGLAYAPIELFVPVANLRLGVIAILLAILIATFRLLARSGMTESRRIPLCHAIRIVWVLLLLLLFTAEVRDTFLRAMEQSRLTESNYADALSGLANLMQLTLSGIWLVYSIGLMIVGLRLRNRILRVLSILLFGFSILKIFIYDLSYLDTLYRIFSFVGLGLILLIVSYLYQRFKDVIFADEMSAATPPAEDVAGLPNAPPQREEPPAGPPV